MKPSTFYFSHDLHARNDKKINPLLRKYKSAGLGIFWALSELIHEENGFLEYNDETIHLLAKDLYEDYDFVKKVLDDCLNLFNLFHIKGSHKGYSEAILLKFEDQFPEHICFKTDKKYIFSLRILRNLLRFSFDFGHDKNERQLSGKKGGIKSGESRRRKLLALSENEANEATNLNKIKEIKEIKEEKKEKEKKEPDSDSEKVVRMEPSSKPKAQPGSFLGRMLETWTDNFPNYAVRQNLDLPALRDISDFLFDQNGLSPGYGNIASELVCQKRFSEICQEIHRDKFFVNKPLSSVSKHIQLFVNNIKNPIIHNGQNHANSLGKSFVADRL